MEAVIDTGFTGFLTLSARLIASLALRFAGATRAALADGSEMDTDVFEAAPLGLGVAPRGPRLRVGVQLSSPPRSALCYSFPDRISRVHSQKMITAMCVECLCLTTSYSVCGRKSVLSTM